VNTHVTPGYLIITCVDSLLKTYETGSLTIIIFVANPKMTCKIPDRLFKHLKSETILEKL